MKTLTQVAALAIALASSNLLANPKLFEVSATTNDALPPVTVSVGSSNFIDFTKSLANSTGSFQILANRAFDASLKYLGVANAIRFSSNAGNTNLTINFLPIGVTKNFVDTPQADATTQFENYFKGDGAGVIADFLKAIAKNSAVALSDGNPNSATAGAAGNLLASEGFTSVDEMDGLESDSASGASAGNKARFNGFGLGFNSAKFKAGPFEGTNSQVSLGKTFFGHVAVSGNLDYLKVEDATIYGGGLTLAVPLRFRQMGQEQPLSWRLTPLLGASLRGSADLANVAPLWEIGAVNSIDYRINSKLVVCVVNQLTMHRSFAMNYRDIKIDPQINQLIAKNGVRVVRPLNRRLVLDGFLVDTRFLKDAMVKSFETIGGSLSLHATTKTNLTLAANYDTGSDYKAYSIGLSSAWKW